jgi:hypothetical protein
MQIEFCESIEGLVRSEGIAIKAANDRSLEWQRRMQKGDCFRRMYDGLEIYGEVLGDYGKGIKVCRCYSLLCPEGETGCVHVSQMSELIDNAIFSKVKTKLTRAWKMAKNVVGSEFPVGRLEFIRA